MSNSSDNEKLLSATVSQLNTFVDKSRTEQPASSFFGKKADTQTPLDKAKHEFHQHSQESARAVFLISRLNNLDVNKTSFASDLRAAVLMTYLDEAAIASERKNNSLLTTLENIMRSPNARLDEDKNNIFLKNANFDSSKIEKMKTAGCFQELCFVLNAKDEDCKPVIKLLFNRVMDLLERSPNPASESLYSSYMKLLFASGKDGVAEFRTLAEKNFNPVFSEILINATKKTSDAEIKTNYKSLSENFELKADIIRYLDNIPKEKGAKSVLNALLPPEKGKHHYKPGSLDI